MASSRVTLHCQGCKQVLLNTELPFSRASFQELSQTARETLLIGLLSGGLAARLIAHTGFGCEATREAEPGDLRMLNAPKNCPQVIGAEINWPDEPENNNAGTD